MASKTLFTILSLSIFIPSSISIDPESSSVTSWCSITPYPKPCEYYFSQNPKYRTIESKSDFFKLSKEVALEQCSLARKSLQLLGPKCRNDREKAAWSDCLKLYDSSVRKISQTLDPKVKCSPDDAQTWLSTAMTNLETCRDGFIDLGVTDNVYHMISNNVSMLLSNTLALNSVGGGFRQPSYKKGFPVWLRPGDRKLLQASNPRADIVVAQDGSGNYRTVTDAIFAAGKRPGSGRYVIYVKQGTYSEYPDIGDSVKNIMLLGDGIGKTIITGSRSVGQGSTTLTSATFSVTGDGFIARGITFRNTAGPSNYQAVALRSRADRSVFYQCGFEGYQDTLFVHGDRQFYKECDIYGTVDFIFGDATVVLQSCNIYARLPPYKTNTLTAQGRKDANQSSGISIHNCRVMASSELKPVQSSVRTYLGRPWKEYSRTVYMKTSMDSLIDPEGWMPMNGSFALDTLYYGEYANTGPGSSTVNRVKWKGYRVITSATEASQFTVGSLIAGDSWLPETTVPFTSGL